MDGHMAYEQRDNSGSIFVNDRKESDNHPDSKGAALIGGVEYWVSAWRKAPPGKKPFLSLSFTPKDDGNRQPAAEAAPAKSEEADIPF
jgi:hypothetical protein